MRVMKKWQIALEWSYPALIPESLRDTLGPRQFVIILTNTGSESMCNMICNVTNIPS